MVTRKPTPRSGGQAWTRLILPMAVIAFGIAAVVALAVFLPKKSPGTAAQETVPVNVKVWTVAPQPLLEDTFDLPGVVEPNRVVQVAAEVPAKVEAYGPRDYDPKSASRPDAVPPPRPPGPSLAEGDRVAAGQPIVYLNTDLLQADYAYAKAQAKFDQLELERIQGLIERNVATRQELNAASTSAARSAAALDTALARLQRAVIASPIDGVLNRLPKEIGEYVQPGESVAEIVDSALVKVVLDVPERDVQYLQVGKAETVRYDRNGQPTQADGRITYLAALADPQTRTTRVEITVDNSQGLLRSGQIVKASLVRRTLRDVIMIRLDTVIPVPPETDVLTGPGQETSGYLVYVVEAGQAQPRRVRLDMTCIKGQRIRVESGLAGGEQLIVDGQRFVGQGQAVRITAGAPATQPDSAMTTPGGTRFVGSAPSERAGHDEAWPSQLAPTTQPESTRPVGTP